MLKFNIFLFKFFRFVQSGFYLDYILKKLSEVFVKNYFIYSSIFFGEKYVIEHLTKKVIESWIFNSNKLFFFFEHFNSYFFIQFLAYSFFSISFFFLIFL